MYDELPSVYKSVSTREAAAFYGIEVKRNGMACCPFHDDKNPSMKVDPRFHCFGCGADGDVIDLTAPLYNLSLKEAAEKLAQDFGLIYDCLLYTSHESLSIRTQKAMLMEYATRNGFGNCQYYVDDGYSGTNSDRPAFQELLDDIRDGKVATVITKDQSRLGRNHIETGTYMAVSYTHLDVYKRQSPTFTVSYTVCSLSNRDCCPGWIIEQRTV